jgi:hypothetical protein
MYYSIKKEEAVSKDQFHATLKRMQSQEDPYEIDHFMPFV